MVQGRTSFSNGSRSVHAFKPGQDSELSFTQAAVSSFYSRPPSSAVDSRLRKRTPDAAENWMLASIERKRVRLGRISASHSWRIKKFVELLFDEESDGYRAIARVLAPDGSDPQDLVEMLFEPAIYRIQKMRWADDCDSLKATIAISRIQRLFRLIAAERPPTMPPNPRRCAMLATALSVRRSVDGAALFKLCVAEDAFRRAGWDVDCCVCDDEANMLRLVAANHYQVVGISVGVEQQLPELKAIGRRLRAQSRNKSIVLIACGSLVMENPQGVIDAGFDLLAVDAVSAVALADTLVASLNVQVHHQLAAE